MSKLSAAVATLVSSLLSDPAFRDTYKANIAEAFVTQWEKDFEAPGVSYIILRKVANAAADNFLNLLCRQVAVYPDPVRTVAEGKKLKTEWNRIKNEKSRWSWVADNSGKVKLMVSNACLSLQFIIDKDVSPDDDETLMELCAEMNCFDEYGWRAFGHLSDSLGITIEEL